MSTISFLDRLLAERKAEDKKLNDCAKLNNKGVEQEKQGDISGAIKTYEKNIDGDCYPACHSFDRLMILYRKAKDFDNEIRVIEKAIDVLGKRYPQLLAHYEDRLSKVQKLKNK